MSGTRSFLTNPIGEGQNLYRTGGWRAQFERVKRWHSRLRTCSGGEYPDFLYAYFQNCNHLADWVVGDVPSWTPRVQQLIAETVELRVCRDICNATKHYTLNQPPKVPLGFLDAREYRPSDWPTDHPGGFPLIFIAGGVRYDGLELADRCLAAWEVFASGPTEPPD